jgi:hypothetical protein
MTRGPAWLRRAWWKKRFATVSRAEKWGYWVWGVMGVVIATPEIWAASRGCESRWPTISTTIGHLQHRAPVLALIPVALIILGAYFTLAFKSRSAPDIVDDGACLAVTTPEGRRAKVPFTSYDQLAPTEALGWTQTSMTQPRAGWRVGRYFIVATSAVVLGWVLALPFENRYLVGYVGYSLIAFFWVVLPNVAAYWFARDVEFTTLVYTVGLLGRRIPIVAGLTAALLAILLIHLALYPWPSEGPLKECSILP